MLFDKVKFILMDIEGTTSSISFVHETLFPFAYDQLPDFYQKHPQLFADQCLDNPVETLRGFIKQDKKDPFLKEIQGHIWQKGFESGELKGDLYPEVKQSLHSWKEQGIQLGIYSSGSVKAQKLLFKYNRYGDLSDYLTEYFDTKVGHKREVSSYQNIIQKLNIAPENILFLSDIKEELDAARLAAMQTCQLHRDDFTVLGEHSIVKNFGQLIINESNPQHGKN